jgi:hypothetical protein
MHMSHSYIDKTCNTALPQLSPPMNALLELNVQVRDFLHERLSHPVRALPAASCESGCCHMLFPIAWSSQCYSVHVDA